MVEKVAYTLIGAAAAYSVSADTLRKAIHTTDLRSFPPPLRAKRLGGGPNAKYMILAVDLAAWYELLLDA